MSFKLLKIGSVGVPRCVIEPRFAVNKKKTMLSLFFPTAAISKSGLKLGDLVQLSVGDGEHKGLFGIGKGETNARKLKNGSSSKTVSVLVVDIPLLPPLAEIFKSGAGRLQVMDQNSQGSFVFKLP
jgi:hypothetical protein